MDPEAIRALIEAIGTDSPPTDPELAEARDVLVAELRAAATADTPDLPAARALREAVDQITAEQATRATTAEEARAEAAQLLDGLGPEDDDEADGENGAETPDDSSEVPDSPPEPVEPVADEAPPAEAPAQPVPVAASAASVAQHLTRRRAHQSTEPETPSVGAFRGVGPAAAFGAVTTRRQMAEVFNRHARDFGSKATLVRAEADHPRRLTSDPSLNQSIVASFAGMEAITAAGGICPPLAALFDPVVCGDRGRPIRDALPSFGPAFGGRGGVTFPPAISFADFTAGITVWDEATDADPGTATKACITIDCDTPVEVTVDAIVACATIGNFQARFNTEQWQAALEALFIAHDAAAEANAWAAIRTAGLVAAAPVAFGDEGQTARSLFVGLDKAAARLRSSNRLLPSTTLRFLAPTWLRDAVRASLTRQQPGDQAFATADAVIDRYFAAANVRPIWSPDIQRLAAQADATNDEFTTPAEGSLFVEGSILFLDGGTLDLGTQITDSTLNSTNDRQAFMETFEAVGVVGCDPVTVSVPVADDCVVCA